MSKYNISHWKAGKAILRYLAGTMDVDILYLFVDGELKIVLEVYADASYAGCPITRRSTTGFVCMINGTAVTWCSKLQGLVTMSTTEAEFMAYVAALLEILWLNSLLTEIGYPQALPIKLYIDNQSAQTCQ